jgi:hypothetical protein
VILLPNHEWYGFQQAETVSAMISGEAVSVSIVDLHKEKSEFFGQGLADFIVESWAESGGDLEPADLFRELLERFRMAPEWQGGRQ